MFKKQKNKNGTNIKKIDLHCHTEASWDCNTPIEEIPLQCLERGISVQAITDHNEIWGAKRLKELVENNSNYNLKIIVGEEISTTEGEIIGLFLDEKIEKWLTPEETVRQIKAQDGLVLLPHGFDPLKKHRLNPAARERLVAWFDIVEAFNTRVSSQRWNVEAAEWARERNYLISGGSDAHLLEDIGDAWTKVADEPIESPLDLLRALKGGQPGGEWTHPVLAFAQKMSTHGREKIGLWLEYFQAFKRPI